MLGRSTILLMLLPALWGGVSCGHVRAQALHASPASVVLADPESTQQLLIRSKAPADLTWSATYEVLAPKVVTVSSSGLVQPLAEGRTVIVVKHGQEQVRIPVEVRGLKSPPPVDFETQIMPILSRGGCNSGGCHGKAEG